MVFAARPQTTRRSHKTPLDFKRTDAKQQRSGGWGGGGSPRHGTVTVSRAPGKSPPASFLLPPAPTMHARGLSHQLELCPQGKLNSREIPSFSSRGKAPCDASFIKKTKRQKWSVQKTLAFSGPNRLVSGISA